MLNLSHTLRLVAAFDENVVAAESNSKVDHRAIKFRLNLLINLVVDDKREATLVRKRGTVTPEVEQVGNGAQWTSTNAHTVWNEFVVVGTFVAFLFGGIRSSSSCFALCGAFVSWWSFCLFFLGILLLLLLV